jgi:Subtilase family
MAEGPPERSARAPLPHILVPWAATDQAYRGRAGGAAKPIRQIGDRRAHAGKLSGELEAARDAAQEKVAEVSPEIAANGFALSVEAWSDDPSYKLAVQSLDTSGAKLLSVVAGTDQVPDRAVVWLPFSAVPAFFKKIEQFATETTSRGAPRNQALVANIAELRLAVLRDLWQEPEQFPDPEEVRWWEVWLARFGRGRSTRNAKASDLGVSPETITASTRPGATLRAIAGEQGWPMAPGLLAFPENVVALVRNSAAELGTILSTSAVPSELHRARVTSEILSVSPFDQNELVADLAGRINAAAPDAGAVCVLDTGLMSGHPLLRASVDLALSVLDGVRPGDDHGHGTSMAGLALFADLNHDLLGNGLIPLRHRIESVKIIRHGVDTDNDPEMYGVITATAAAAVETEQSRRRVFSMAVTVDDPDGSDGRPTSYSASLDALAFGTDIARTDYGIELLGQPDPHGARLFVVSAGNIRHGYQVNHLDVSDLSRVQNPAQAWNALTVGAYTELVNLPQKPIYAGWRALAETGELSPFSRTSITFGRAWPVKPDIVLEGGNLLVNSSNTELYADPELALVTTSNAEQRLLTTANATSAATAQAARLAAVTMDRYPELWPETVRGLIVHAAEWTPAMETHLRAAGKNKTRRLLVLRRYGWGVPIQERVLSSAASSVTLMLQDEFEPFEPSGSGLSMRAFRFHELPWPREQLRELFGATVRLRVTLSYFVEPNPSSRGWQGRYRYASHGLRFDVKRPTETLEDFRRRLGNAAAREEGDDAPQPETSADDRWYVGSRLRNSGSLHADIWTGTGAELADSGYIGITPVGGWWKENNRKDRADLPVRYALLVSLRTDEIATDIYTPIVSQIGIPVAITT